MTTTASRLPAPPSAAAELAADALELMKRARVRPALALLEKLPAMFAAEMTDAVGAASWEGYCRGYEQGRLALTREITHGRRAPAAKPPRAQKTSHASWLRELIEDPALRRRVLDVLRIRDADLDAIVEGRAGLAPSSWRRLRRELGE